MSHQVCVRSQWTPYGPMVMPGRTVEPGLMLVAMEDEAVDAGRERPVAERLHRAGVGLPGLGVARCEGFGGDDAPAAGVGDARRPR